MLNGTRAFRLGAFVVRPDQNRLVGASGEVRLEPKVMALLVALARRPDEVVTRRELLDEVWAPSVVTDEAVTRCISELRTVLGDDRGRPRYIQTVPKRGYRLLVPPEPADAQAPVAGARRRRVPAAAATVAAVVILVTSWSMFPAGDRAPATEEPPSVAVLPFTAMTDDRDAAYFGAGLAEELLSALVDVGDLRVASRSSSFHLDAEQRTPVEIGRMLSVDAVLTGSIRRQGDRIRVTAQLIDTEGGFHRWSETYDARVRDLFEIQDSIATAIAGALEVELSGPIRVARIADNIEALDYYLLGRHHWHRRTPESLRRAVTMFEAAIAADPQSAVAYSGLADAYLLLSFYGDLDPDRALAEAAPAVERALALAPDSAEANASLGLAHLQREHFREAADAFQRAVDLDPHYAMAFMWLGNALKHLGRAADAHSAYLSARSLDRRHPVIAENLIFSSIDVGDYAAADALMADFDSLDTDARARHKVHAFLALSRRDLETAERAARSLCAAAPEGVQGPLLLAELYRLEGDAQRARRWLERAIAIAPESPYVQDAALAFYAWRGEREALFAVLDERHGGADASLDFMENVWVGVLFLRREQPLEAIAYLERALAQGDPEARNPAVRVRAVGYLLAAYGPDTEAARRRHWATQGRSLARQARAAGWASIGYRLDEAFMFAAMGDVEAAVSHFHTLLTLADIPGSELADDPRTAPIRDSAELGALLESLTRARLAGHAGVI